MKAYHRAWLDAHPERSVEWLKRMLREGFQVHHVDGDHGNNHPANLVLIECVDHMRLHGMFGLARKGIHLAQRNGGNNRWLGASAEEKSKHCRMMAMVAVKNARNRRRAAREANRPACPSAS